MLIWITWSFIMSRYIVLDTWVRGLKAQLAVSPHLLKWAKYTEWQAN